MSHNDRCVIWPLRCWACEELLAMRSSSGKLLLEADAGLIDGDDHALIVCRCGERTILLTDRTVTS